MELEIRGQTALCLLFCAGLFVCTSSSPERLFQSPELSTGAPQSNQVHGKDSVLCCSATCFVQAQRIALRSSTEPNLCLLQQSRGIRTCRSRRVLPLRCSEDDKQDKDAKKEERSKETLPPFVMKEMFASLKDRQKQVESGAGRVYLVCTQLGFLNVHNDPSDPTRLDNVVTQIFEGDIVESVGPDHGSWVQHDLGGWSIREYGNFTWLKPLDEALEEQNADRQN